MPLILILVLLLLPQLASAYPEFIGYKYATCLTCHFNGHGNGPLNDYGRALWAAEIGGRAFAGGRTDEQLGEASNLFGRRQLPWWLRPGFKSRTLVYQPNPPSTGANTRYIIMQADANLALLFNKEQKYAFVGSIGYVPQPARLGAGAEKVPEVISREHYFRMLTGQNLWLYFGFLDKVYGIRHVNHTAYSRVNLGLAQNDQSHGVIAHYIQPTWEFTVNAFGGNLYQENADVRQMGASVSYETELKEAWRLGTSFLYSTSKFVGNTRAGVFSRYGFGYGSAILAEVGLLQDKPKTGEAKNGYYVYSEATQRLFRGFHVFMVAQAFKDRMEGNRPDKFKTGAGILVFPAQRFEWRTELENSRSFTDNTEVQRESWTVLSQLHISL